MEENLTKLERTHHIYLATFQEPLSFEDETGLHTLSKGIFLSRHPIKLKEKKLTKTYYILTLGNERIGSEDFLVMKLIRSSRAEVFVILALLLSLNFLAYSTHLFLKNIVATNIILPLILVFDIFFLVGMAFYYYCLRDKREGLSPEMELIEMEATD